MCACLNRVTTGGTKTNVWHCPEMRGRGRDLLRRYPNSTQRLKTDIDGTVDSHTKSAFAENYLFN